MSGHDSVRSILASLVVRNKSISSSLSVSIDMIDTSVEAKLDLLSLFVLIPWVNWLEDAFKSSEIT